VLDVLHQLGAAFEPGLAVRGEGGGAGDPLVARRVLVVIGLELGDQGSRHRGRRVSRALEQRDRALVRHGLGVAARGEPRRVGLGAEQRHRGVMSFDVHQLVRDDRRELGLRAQLLDRDPADHDPVAERRVGAIVIRDHDARWPGDARAASEPIGDALDVRA